MSIFHHRQDFGGSAKAYQRFRTSYDLRAFRPFFRALDRKDARVLDLGCGTGKSSEPIARAGYRVVGVDPDPRMLREARASAKKNRLKIRYMRGAAERLPFKAGTFDGVSVGTAFHWFSSARALREIRRVLKPGTPLFIFWQMAAPSGSGRRKSIHALFRRHHLKLVPEHLMDSAHVVQTLRRAGFSGVKTSRFSFTQRRTLTELVGRFCTTSSYHALPDAKKEPFIADLTEFYKSRLGRKKASCTYASGGELLGTHAEMSDD